MVVISSGSDMMCCRTHTNEPFSERKKGCICLYPTLHILSAILSYLGQCAFYTVSSDDDSVPLVSAPALEELPGEAALHHTRRRHHHTGADVIKVIHALEKTRHRS